MAADAADVDFSRTDCSGHVYVCFRLGQIERQADGREPDYHQYADAFTCSGFGRRRRGDAFSFGGSCRGICGSVGRSLSFAIAVGISVT
ncbi:hypothetical protein D3C72_1802920 [compost metagenome]